MLSFGEFTVEEVEAAKKVKATDIKKVVDDPEWQSIRKSLIGNWKNNHKQNVDTLRSYFDKNKKDPLAVRRVINVLTGSVHRVGCSTSGARWLFLFRPNRYSGTRAAEARRRPRIGCARKHTPRSSAWRSVR